MGKKSAEQRAERDGAERAISSVKLPEELELVRFDIVQACTHPEDPRSWPETEPAPTFLRAYGPEQIARYLVKAYHVSIRKAQIAYLWKEQLSEGPTKVKLAHAQKAPAQLKFLAEVDFVLTFNHAAWRVLTAEQKIALVDHELAHCDWDSETDKPALVPHDIEEFGLIVKRHGLWKPDLKAFGDCVLTSLQLPLFPEEAGSGRIRAEDVLAARDKAARALNAALEQQVPPPKAKDVTSLRLHE